MRKTREGAQHPNRDAQFQLLRTIQAAMKALGGLLKNAGQEWQKKKTPVEIRVPDFKDPVLAKAAPYGVYDLAANQGWLSVGNRSRYSGVRRWWQ